MMSPYTCTLHGCTKKKTVLAFFMLLIFITDVLAVGGDFFGHAHLIPSWSVKYVCESDSCSLQPDSMQRDCPHAGVFCESESVTYMHLAGGAYPPTVVVQLENMY